MCKADFGIPEDELEKIKAFGTEYHWIIDNNSASAAFLLYAKGHSITEIASRFGHSREKIRKFIVSSIREFIRYRDYLQRCVDESKE